MSDFKNSFYAVATKIAKKNPLSAPKQLTLIDDFTAESPILKELPFEQASHDCHHVYGRLLDTTSMQVTDLDGVLPSMQTDSQLESIYLTPFGGKFEFGEDRMRLTHDTPESYLTAQIPPVLRKTGMALEHIASTSTTSCRQRLRTARHGLPTWTRRQIKRMTLWLPLRGSRGK